MENRKYFSNIQKQYQAYYEYSWELYQNVAERLDKILFGKVVDFGNGGIINYNTDRLEKLICVDIINKNRIVTDNKIDFVYGDFYEIQLDRDFDCILIQFLLHHLTDDERLYRSFRRLRHSIKDKGKIVILEVVIPRCLEQVQRLFKPLISWALKVLRKPHLRFFACDTVVRFLSTLEPSEVKIRYIPVGKKVIPAPILFPKLKLPGRLYPLRCILIEASFQH